jgi:hypothetical protein
MDNSERVGPSGENSCLKFLLRILFIYKKIEEGWVVRKKENNEFEFFKAIDRDSATFSM